MKSYTIKITGSGTPLEIVDALSAVQKSILASTEDKLDGAQLEDETLMTVIELEE
jgi:hypothetical protein